MARPVALRLSWRTDAAFLLRLEEAIERDQVQSPEWKRVAREKARELAQHLLTAKRPVEQSQPPRVTSRRAS